MRLCITFRLAIFMEHNVPAFDELLELRAKGWRVTFANRAAANRHGGRHPFHFWTGLPENLCYLTR